MTTDVFDPYDDEGNLARAQQEAMADLIKANLQRVLRNRPPVFDRPGELHPDIAAWCDRIRQRTAGPLVIVGGTGAGKTWSLWKAAVTLAESGWRKRFTIIDAYELREAIAPPVDDAQLDTWKRADVLAIDDLGAQRVTDWVLDKLHPIIDYRWKHGLPTAVTTNITDIRAALDERIASRLSQNATVVQFTDTDHRRTQ